jgi:hypothetical protein
MELVSVNKLNVSCILKCQGILPENSQISAEYSYRPGAPRQANGSQTQHGDETTIVAYAIRDTRILVD